MSCASSLIPAKDPVHETDTDPQNIGTAVHDLLRLHVEGEAIDEATISHVCTRERADIDEVGMRVRYGIQAWEGHKDKKDGLKHYFDRVGAEEAFEVTMLLRVAGKRVSVTLTGHPDLGGSDCTMDYKGGRVYSNYVWQVQGYNYAKHRTWGILLWLIDRRYDVVKAMPRAEFEAAIAEQLALVGKEYNPGSHCGFCPRRDECGARQKRMRGVYELLVGTDDELRVLKQERDDLLAGILEILNDYKLDSAIDANPKSVAESLRKLVSEARVVHAPREGILTSEKDLARAYPLKRQLESCIKAYDTALGAWLDEHGSLPLGDGTEVYIREETRREVDVQTAWPVLAEALTVEQLAMCVNLGVTAISEAVKQVVRDEYAEKGEKVPKGELGKAVKVMWEQLGEAGAVSEIIRRVKATRKVK
jgi:hypothetical protein